MIKSFLIVVLAAGLALAALVTRPSERSAAAFLADGRQPAAAAPGTLAETLKDVLIKAADAKQGGVPKAYEFKDRVLWVEVRKDGRTAYTGVLSHWIRHDIRPDAPASPDKAGPKLASK